jgi:hypothetical protein
MSDIGTNRDREEERTGTLNSSEELVSRAASNGQLFKLNREAANGTCSVSNLNS